MAAMDPKRPTIVLDLDSTLIFSLSKDEAKSIDLEKNAKGLAFHTIAKYYISFERPGLQQFLDYIFNNFNVVIWTAASKDYACEVAKKIVVGDGGKRDLRYLFFLYHGEISQKKHGCPKDLKLLWDTFNLSHMNADKVFIIDDNEDVWEPQPKNAIAVPVFDVSNPNSPKDDFLIKLKDELKKMLKNNSGVQTVVPEINAKIGAKSSSSSNKN